MKLLTSWARLVREVFYWLGFDKNNNSDIILAIITIEIMKLAIIKTGGKQYLVSEKDKLKVEKLNVQEGQSIEFDEVLLYSDGDKLEVGTPTLKKKVTARVLNQGRSKKVRVVKYKPKVRYHKVYGHRQPFTEIEIEKIG